MKLCKHKAHRNAKYLSWLRKQNCVVSGKKAQCAHHIRLGTNGGAGLKPSDYFCIPLLNEYHTSGLFALHYIGEETFLKEFHIKPNELFIMFLKKYLLETYDINYNLDERTDEEMIADLIGLIENKRPQEDFKAQKIKKKKPTSDNTSGVKTPKISESEYYQRAKELKKICDKKLRKKVKEEKKQADQPKPTFKGNEFYEKAKELKRKRDKELRQILKDKNSDKSAFPKKAFKGNELYEKAKEERKRREKEYRQMNKERIASHRKELRQKMKELKKLKEENRRQEV